MSFLFVFTVTIRCHVQSCCFITNLLTIHLRRLKSGSQYNGQMKATSTNVFSSVLLACEYDKRCGLSQTLCKEWRHERCLPACVSFHFGNKTKIKTLDPGLRIVTASATKYNVIHLLTKLPWPQLFNADLWQAFWSLLWPYLSTSVKSAFYSVVAVLLVEEGERKEILKIKKTI